VGSTGSIPRESKEDRAKRGHGTGRWRESEAAGRFGLAGESLVALGKLWIYIYIYCIHLGLGDW